MPPLGSRFIEIDHSSVTLWPNEGCILSQLLRGAGFTRPDLVQVGTITFHQWLEPLS